jgi:predicted Zn-dependent peptidase
MPQEYGYAHFVEHMLFKGTQKNTAKDIARLIDRVGGQHNAATNREYTCYYINVVSDYIDLALDVLSDMYYNSLLDAEELEKEKNIIIEEIRMYEDTPDEFVHDMFMEKMLLGHPLSHSILGSIDTIKNSDRKSLDDFYKRFYRNDNAILVIAGKFTENQAREIIEKYFNKTDPEKTEIEKIVTNPPKRIDVEHYSRDLEQVHFCLGVDGIKKNDEARWPLYALSTILGGSMSSRLFQNIREKEGISYSIYSFHSSYSDYGIFGVYCATVPDRFYKALELIIREFKDIQSGNFTDEEIQDAKTFMKGNLALSLESPEVRMGQLAKNEITFGRSFDFNELSDQINSITRDDFKTVVDRLFSKQSLSMVSVGDIKDFAKSKLDLNLA